MRIAIIGPVYPYRAGIAYCTTRLAEELRKTAEVDVVSFSRQYPKRFYPGGDDVDPTLPRTDASFLLDILSPLTWLATGLTLRQQKYDAVIFVWWIWVWALPYRVVMALLSRRTRVILQCHNIGDKEPARWKRALTNLVLRRRGNVLVTHAQTEAAEGWSRSHGRRTVRSFLPVHELGREVPSREEARRTLGIGERNVALFFGHVRPFKALDVVLRAWKELQGDVLLYVAGEAWWEGAEEYRAIARGLGLAVEERTGASGAGSGRPQVRFEFRFIPDAEIATYFAAADVVLAPYRVEAQSGVALTAFHFARPVIASTVGGLPEIVQPGRTGLLVPPDDPAELARAVDAFFTTSDRAVLESGAAAAARRYSWEEYARVFARLAEGL